MRKLAREAVIFMLLGPVVTFFVVFLYVQKQSISGVKTKAAQAVFAVDAPPLPGGYTVLVPLTNGLQLFVADCARTNPPARKQEVAPRDKTDDLVPIPPGASNGIDCMYFSDPNEKLARHYGGQLLAVPLGDANQIVIEEIYWTAYAKAKREMRGETALVAGFASLYGFPGGLVLWGLYRLVRFAVQG